MCRLIERGYPPEWLLDLDMLSFSGLSESSDRIQAQNMLSETVSRRVSAHANKKEMKKYWKSLEKRSRVEDPQTSGDSTAFKMRFGKGG